ncbi:MAG: hypothetical protein D6732_25140 [Methanobacteriota archaeon]|nr:MAG: hypothetical protein D6732_25140 [Euryarchaeota archaeon]
MSFLVTFTIGLKVIESVVLLLVSFLSFRHYLRTKITPLLYLSLMMLFTMLQTIIQILPLVNAQVNTDLIAILFTILVAGFFIFLLIFLYHFYGEYSIQRTGIAIGIFMAQISLLVIVLNTGDISVITNRFVIDGRIYFAWSNAASLTLSPSMLIIGYWTYKIMKQSEQNAFYPNQKKQITIMKWGFYISIWLTAIVSVPGTVFLQTGNYQMFILFIYVIQGLTLTTGFLLVSYGMLVVNQSAFIQPYKLISILVIHRTGLPVYQHMFYQNKAILP